MMGVTDVSVDGDTVSITYDLLQATAKQLEARAAEIGLKIGGSWTDGLRSALVHYLEECEVDNLEVGHHRHHRHG
jgi:phospholipase/lecithinase/hemolysin